MLEHVILGNPNLCFQYVPLIFDSRIYYLLPENCIDTFHRYVFNTMLTVILCPKK